MEFSELVKNRYSVRAYKDTPIEQAKLDAILEAGRRIPSAHNNQPQKIYVARNKEVLDKLASVCPCTFGAPVILVVGFDETRERKSKMNPGFGFGEMDATIACTQMMLQAEALGIGSCWIGMFNRQTLRDALDLPQSITVTALLLLGYAAENVKPLPLHFQKREPEEIVEEL